MTAGAVRRGARALVAGLALGGCALVQPAGDRLFADGHFVAARAAYEDYLASGRAAGRRRERALYPLGLIHARPGGELHDPVEARRYLERLLAVEPPSPYATQAALILDLQLAVSKLRGEMADQRSLARLLLAELRRLRSEAEQIENRASGEQERARELGRQIQRLERTMKELAAELAARQDELERLKKIDLEDPP